MPGLQHGSVVNPKCSEPWCGPELVLEVVATPNAVGFNAVSLRHPAWGLAVHLSGGTPELCPDLLPKHCEPQCSRVWIWP